MYELFSSLLKYIFITIIYIFIFSIIRLIYLDIRSMYTKGKDIEGFPYLKLINRMDSLNFKVQESYVLDSDKIIGRSKKCDIVIPDSYLSKKHVQIFYENGVYLLEDLDSTNGTFVNNHRIENKPVPLRNGDRISIGQCNFLFVNDT